jgi:hypothetical protein
MNTLISRRPFIGAKTLAACALFAAGISAVIGQTVDVVDQVVMNAANAPIRQGNPFSPTGADFQIVALQGIDSSSMLGKTGFAPQVNMNFEFNPSIGVTYDNGSGKLTDFGLGLYANAAHQTQSTGLQIQYDAPVLASSVKITVEDFDLKSNATAFDSKKVEPSLLLLGPGNTIYASLTPGQIFPSLVAETATGGKKAAVDVWDLNFSDLLSSLHLADAPITGFVLYADSANGETPNSDPYLLVSVGNGVPVPEPATWLLLCASIALVGPCFRKSRTEASGLK